MAVSKRKTGEILKTLLGFGVFAAVATSNGYFGRLVVYLFDAHEAADQRRWQRRAEALATRVDDTQDDAARTSERGRAEGEISILG